jgi:enoyl-CoA hydratase/carnithine racemase
MANDRIEIDTGTGELLREIRDRVALITLNRPEARNALSDHLTPALRRMIKQCGRSPCRRCVADIGRGHGLLRRR